MEPQAIIPFRPRLIVLELSVLNRHLSVQYFSFTINYQIKSFYFPRVAKEVEEHMLGWNIPEEHQDMVHEHWRNFPAVSKYWHYCLALIYTMLMITSLTGNGIVIWIFGT